jgi:AcrR family transcriptional regulator
MEIMTKTREFILKTSLGLFLEKGYKATTMSELVKKAGLTKGAFYHYFESKELLFRAAVESCVIPMLDPDPALDTKDKTLRQFYHDYVDYYFSVMETLNGVSPLRYHILLLDYVHCFPDNASQLVKSAQQPERSMWNKVIQNAKSRGEIRSEVDNERIVDMFIFSSDGVGLHNTIVKNVVVKTAMLAMWDSLYDLLKKK